MIGPIRRLSGDQQFNADGQLDIKTRGRIAATAIIILRRILRCLKTAIARPPVGGELAASRACERGGHGRRRGGGD